MDFFPLEINFAHSIRRHLEAKKAIICSRLPFSCSFFLRNFTQRFPYLKYRRVFQVNGWLRFEIMLVYASHMKCFMENGSVSICYLKLLHIIMSIWHPVSKMGAVTLNVCSSQILKPLHYSKLV